MMRRIWLYIFTSAASLLIVSGVAEARTFVPTDEWEQPVVVALMDAEAAGEDPVTETADTQR